MADAKPKIADAGEAARSGEGTDAPACSPQSDGTTATAEPICQRTEPRALGILVCPLTKSVLEYDETRQELISRRANLAYPIRSGVPLLTREAARNLDEKCKG